MIQHKRHRQSGQAMTEFVVSVSFVFLSLFVIVPMFGKLMDMQYQNQQASRYVAWERTVWFDQDEAPDESDAPLVMQSTEAWRSVATRSDAAVMNTVESRFFRGTGPGDLKRITVDDTKVASDQMINPVWTYVQSKKTMYGGTTLGTDDDLETGRKTSLDRQLTPAAGYKVIDILDQGLTLFRGPINAVAGAIGGDNDDFMTFGYEIKNYFSPVLTTELNKDNAHGWGKDAWDRDDKGNWGTGIEKVIFSNWDGKLKSRSAILADGWNTQSLDHYIGRADDLVFSTVFDNDIINTVVDTLTDIGCVLEGGPDNCAIGKFEFGGVGIEPMPAKEGGGPMDVSDDKDRGYYYYDD